MAIPGQDLDFSWLADLPATFEEARAKADIRQALSGIDTSDADSLERASRALLRSGRDRSVKLGIDLGALAQKQRDVEISRQQTKNLGDFFGGGGQLPAGPSVSPRVTDPRNKIPTIRRIAQEENIDPDVAVRVASSEGLGQFTSGIPGERSYGAFQLNVDSPSAMGNQFRRDTGLDPSDPNNEDATIRYALRQAKQGGWTPFHGAKNTGIGQFEGIRGVQPQAEAAGPVQVAQAGGPSAPGGGLSARGELNKLMFVIANSSKADPAARNMLLEVAKSKLDELKPTPQERNWFNINADRATRGEAPVTYEQSLSITSGRETPEEGAEKQFLKGNVEAAQKEYGVIADQGKASEKTLGTIRRMKQIVDTPDFYSGFGTPTAIKALQAGGSVFKALGLDVKPEFSRITDAEALISEFTALGKQMLLSATGGSLGNQISNTDRDFLEQAQAGVANSPKGNRALLLVAEQIHERQQELANVARDYMKSAGSKASRIGLDEALEKYKNEHPLFQDAAGKLTSNGKMVQGLMEAGGAGAQTPDRFSRRQILPEDEGRTVTGPGGKQYTIQNGVPVPVGQKGL